MHSTKTPHLSKKMCRLAKLFFLIQLGETASVDQKEYIGRTSLVPLFRMDIFYELQFIH